MAITKFIRILPSEQNKHCKSQQLLYQFKRKNIKSLHSEQQHILALSQQILQ